MKIPMSWLKDYMEIDTSKVTQYSEAMTMSGTIVEAAEDLGAEVRNVRATADLLQSRLDEAEQRASEYQAAAEDLQRQLKAVTATYTEGAEE